MTKQAFLKLAFISIIFVFSLFVKTQPVSAQAECGGGNITCCSHWTSVSQPAGCTLFCPIFDPYCVPCTSSTQECDSQYTGECSWSAMNDCDSACDRISGTCSSTLYLPYIQSPCNPATSWTTWSACPVCGTNVTTSRFNTCTGETDYAICAINACPPVCDPNIWSSWSTCSAVCIGDTGTQSRTNQCNTTQTQNCSGTTNCTGCTWNSWSSCSNSCGWGTRSRSDSCNNIQTEPCYDWENFCETCDENSWSAWTACSSACDGTQSSTNDCRDVRTQPCNVGACAGTTQVTTTPVDCSSGLGLNDSYLIGETMNFNFTATPSTKVFTYDNDSFELNNFSMWPTSNHLQYATIINCTSSGQPCGDGLYFLAMKEDLSVPNADPYLASDWIELGEDPSGKPYTMTLMARSGGAGNQFVDRLFLQTYPVNGDWSNGTSTEAPINGTGGILASPTWQTFNGTATFNVPPAGYSSTKVRIVLRTPNAPNTNEPIYYDGTGFAKYNTMSYSSIWYHPLESGPTANYCNDNGWTAIGNYVPQITPPITVPAGFPNAQLESYSCTLDAGRPKYRVRLQNVSTPYSTFGYSEIMLSFMNTSAQDLNLKSFIGTPTWDVLGGWFGYKLGNISSVDSWLELSRNVRVGSNSKNLQEIADYMVSQGYTPTLKVAANIRNAAGAFTDHIGTLELSFNPNVCGGYATQSLPGQFTYSWTLNSDIIEPGEYYFVANPTDTAGNWCTGNPSGTCGGTTFTACTYCNKRVTICPNAPGAIATLNPSGSITVTEDYTLPLSWSAATGLSANSEYQVKIFKQGAGTPDSVPCNTDGTPTEAEAVCATVTGATSYNLLYSQSKFQPLGYKLTAAVRGVNLDSNVFCPETPGNWKTSDISLYLDSIAYFSIDEDQDSHPLLNLCTDPDFPGGNGPTANLNGATVTLSSRNFAMGDHVTRSVAAGTSATFISIPFFSYSWNAPGSDIQISAPPLINPGTANALFLVCPANGTLAGIYPSNNNARFFYTQADLSHGPWWQSWGGLVFAENGIRSELPTDPTNAPASDCASVSQCNNNLYLITKEIGSASNLTAGLPMRGAGGTYAGFDGRWTDRTPSAQTGVVNPSAGRNHTNAGLIDQNYDFFARDLVFTTANSPSSISNLSQLITQTDLDTDGTRVAHITGNMTLETGNGANFNVGTNSYVVFVDGDLIIKGNSNSTNIRVAEGGFMGFIVSGRIIIDSDIGYVNTRTDVTSNNSNLQGVFVGNQIIVAGHSDPLADGGNNNNNLSDYKFIGAGTFVGWNGVSLNRDYENANSAISKALNNTDPTEAFEFRPDFVINSPGVLKKSLYTWQEVN